jgi:hypothetical protein
MLIILDNPRGTQTLEDVLVIVKHVNHVKKSHVSHNRQVMWHF